MRKLKDVEVFLFDRMYRIRVLERVGYDVPAHRITYGGPLFRGPDAEDLKYWFYCEIPKTLRDKIYTTAYNVCEARYRRRIYRLGRRCGLGLKINPTFTLVTLEHARTFKTIVKYTDCVKNNVNTGDYEVYVDGESEIVNGEVRYTADGNLDIRYSRNYGSSPTHAQCEIAVWRKTTRKLDTLMVRLFPRSLALQIRKLSAPYREGKLPLDSGESHF